MDHKEVGKYWNENAQGWTKLSRLGYDRYRNLLNTPIFFKILPNVDGLKGLDIGCGEGYNTRITAKKGANMTAVDISEVFINYSLEKEHEEPLGINYQLASAVELPFPDNNFDFAIATMSLMDIPENDLAIKEAFRVIKLGGFLQFSITNPVVSNSGWDWVTNEKGERTGFICKDYFENKDGEIEEWIFGAAPNELTENLKKFHIPRFQRTLSQWLNLLIQTGFRLEYFEEPHADDDLLIKIPQLYHTRIVPLFLIVRCRK